MAFLNRNSLSKLADEATVTPHVLFEVCEPSVDVRMAYLQGCVLAVLINDEDISESDYRKLRNLGASLKLSQDDIDSCIKSVEELSSDQEKEAFVTECLALLKSASKGVPHYFMQDFQSFMDFSSNSELKEYVDDFGTILFADRDWKSIDEKQFKALQEEIEAQKLKRDTQLFISDMNEQLASLESKEVLDNKDVEQLENYMHSQSYKSIGVTAVKNELLEANDSERQNWRRMLFLGLFLGKVRKVEDLVKVNVPATSADAGATRFFGTVFREQIELLKKAEFQAKDREKSQTMSRARMIELLVEWDFV